MYGFMGRNYNLIEWVRFFLDMPLCRWYNAQCLTDKRGFMGFLTFPPEGRPTLAQRLVIPCVMLGLV